MTTATPMVFDSAQELSETSREGLRCLLTACADTKLLLGFHYGEWTFGTPELEAAVASCSLAQASSASFLASCDAASGCIGTPNKVNCPRFLPFPDL